MTGCADPGEFRAPAMKGGYAGFDGPAAYRWLCLDHVREFNAGYDFFAGMDAEEVFSAQHPIRGFDHQPRVYARGGGGPAWAEFTDPLEAIGARFAGGVAAARPEAARVPRHIRRALKTLQLPDEATRTDIRRRYSQLVRRYHPDRNGGDRSYEKNLADVIAAYTQLKRSSYFT